MPNISAPPYQTPIEDLAITPETGRPRKTGFFNSKWVQWLLTVVAVVNLALRTVGRVRLEGQTAAIAASVAAVSSSGSGDYWVSVFLRVSRAATINSAVQVTLRWTDGGIAQALALTNVNGNTTASLDSQLRPIHADAASPITYETSYTSNGATAMAYELTVTVVEVPAP